MNATSTAPPRAANGEPANSFPWAGKPDEVACNFAFGLLVREMPKRLTVDGKMHAPTLMAAAGAIAGVCAQASFLADADRVAKAKAEDKIMDARLKDGRTLLFGDALNAMLYSVDDVVLAQSRVWNMMVSAALLKGMDRNAMPQVPEMFKHVGSSFGTEREGRPSVPANAQPMADVRNLLRVVGPSALFALAGDQKATPGLATQRPLPDRKSWVSITAQVAANMLLNSVRVMPAELCLTIGMESAIYASKLRARTPATDAPSQA